MDWLIIIGILLIPTIAQMYVSANFSKYKKITLKNKISGAEVARKILDANGLEKIYVVETNGNLTDHYDPKRKVIRLSKEIFNGETVAAASVAAHEVGHALQDKEGYLYMKVRSFLFPIVRIATSFSYAIVFIGILAEMTNLFYLGIALVSLGLLFQIITLPVEFNASTKAKEILKTMNIVDDSEIIGSKVMLNAAAMTYVAGVLASALELLRLILVFNNRRD